jgi:hypothetical protein
MFGLVQCSSVSLSMTFINATQIAGMASFGIAAILSVANWQAARSGKRQWGAISVIAAMLAAECVVGLRHRAHAVATDWLVAHDLYGARNTPQEYLIAAVALAGFILLLIMAARGSKRTAAYRAAWLATIMSLVLFLTETVSLHGFDAALYRALGPLAVIGWLWIVLGSAISLSARAETRRTRT